MGAYRCHLDGQPVEATVGPLALVVAGRSLPWADMEDVVVDGWTATLQMVTGAPVVLTHLGRTKDDFLRELHGARSKARGAALLQRTGGAPIDTYTARNEAGAVKVELFFDSVVVEPEVGTPTMVPLGLVERVERDGYAITLHQRLLPAVTIKALGKRTDELLQDLEKARADLAAKVADAYAGLGSPLAGFSAPDGWAVTSEEAAHWWGALRDAFATDVGADEWAVLHGIAGDRMRIGLKVGFEGNPIPFALVPGKKGTAVEGAGDEARATYVFTTTDLDRLNLALLLTSFRREAIYLADDALGRWGAAVRHSEVVRWARSVFRTRVIHDELWPGKVTAALS